MDLLYQIFVDPFVQMATAPDLFAQTLWEGMVGGVLYALIALGFVLIFKASGVFNFAQGIMVVFAALTLVGFYNAGVPAFLALGLSIAVMFALAFAVERIVLRPLINQPQRDGGFFDPTETVGHFELVNRKGGHLDNMPFELVVPAEFRSVACKS